MDSAEDSYAPVAQEQVECNEHSNKRIDTPDAQHIHFSRVVLQLVRRLFSSRRFSIFAALLAYMYCV